MPAEAAAEEYATLAKSASAAQIEEGAVPITHDQVRASPERSQQLRRVVGCSFAGLLLAAVAAAAVAFNLRQFGQAAVGGGGEHLDFLEAIEEDECKGCKDSEYAHTTGVISNPSLLGGAMTFEDVQSALRTAKCPLKCKRRMKKDKDEEKLPDVEMPKKPCKKTKKRVDVDADVDADEEAAEDEIAKELEALQDSRRLAASHACHTSVRGELCHDAVVWTMQKGIPVKPTYYKGLSNLSSFEEVQAHVHAQRPQVCPKPCRVRHMTTFGHVETKNDVEEVLAQVGMEDESDDEADDEDCIDMDGDDLELEEEEDAAKARMPHNCHTAEKGEECYTNVLWIAVKGLKTHPKWFRHLNAASSFEQIQEFLHKDPNSTVKCPMPCPETCHNALKGEPCYESVSWALAEGIAKNPQWYTGINVKSSFKEVQYFLHNDPNAAVYCPEPCGACHTAAEGERCFSAVDWVQKVGIEQNPDSYKGLTPFSSFEEIQDHLHKNKSEAKSRCPKPCPPDIPGVEA